MRQQKGCVSIDRNKWVCRWRENVPNGNGETVRKLQFKVLGDVTADHRRNKDRKTGKPRIPDDIQARANALTGAANSSGISALTTIGQFVDGTYFPEKQLALKPASYEALRNRWRQYLEGRIASCVLRGYQRKDAAQLWREIQRYCPHLSGQTFRHIRFTVRGIFETAKDHGLYSGENPASASLPPNLPGKQETQAYSIDEVTRMLSLLTADPMGQAIVALFFGSGCRKGEVAALDWTDYERTVDGAIIHVRRNSWRGQIVTTKTVSSKDDVVIDNEICKYVDGYHALIGNPASGPMFHNTSDNRKKIKAKQSGNHNTPGNEALINLDSFARWQIKPILERCINCGKGKSAHSASADHKYQRNQTVPQWKGWHAFRRGNATFLAQQCGVDGRAAATLMLRHTDASTTEDSYILESKQDRRAAQAGKLLSVQRTRQQAAASIGNGLRTH